MKSDEIFNSQDVKIPIVKARMMTKKQRPEPLPQILDISPYVPGHAPSPSTGRVFKLASNENPLGASPAARRAVEEATSHLEVYPDGNATRLREAIAERYGLDANRIICGAGSDEIFQMLGKAYLEKGDEIIQSTHGFLVYELVAQQAGAITKSAPEKQLHTDVDAILDCVTEKTKIVFIANPNNPTGTYISFEEVRRLHAGLPSHVILVLDGAYAEYVRANDYAAGIELVSEFENVVMTRTFSKIYGLAALRLGWAYAPAHIIDALHRVRGPFNVSETAQLAGIAAIQDQAFLETSLAHNNEQRERLFAGLEKLGLDPVPSVANFILAKFPEKLGQSAVEAAKFLDTKGVSVRAMVSYKLPHCLRISVGSADSVDAVLSGLEEFLAAS
ncbi:histidinol-phosphate transaminase [Hirschia baltica]|uniref:Histidinol-phosphate aminotransferase n=1 Tax=Hirschia baltica (strain ATCC 49814 / DSM 5838 / IFAM 1418) TaxID=582402 RepID=C6XLM3_HIRBI|nr:histidinol-phosphate transaminase [Hirschia baltica]ACT57929.1 histidinol-phosphate aminotransferase [Hirschia baltica ATCC 49814]